MNLNEIVACEGYSGVGGEENEISARWKRRGGKRRRSLG